VYRSRRQNKIILLIGSNGQFYGRIDTSHTYISMIIITETRPFPLCCIEIHTFRATLSMTIFCAVSVHGMVTNSAVIVLIAASTRYGIEIFSIIFPIGSYFFLRHKSCHHDMMEGSSSCYAHAG